MRTGHRVVDPDRAAKIFGGCSALALMTKAPRAGQVKTRLVPPLTNEEAAQLNGRFLQDTGTAISVCCRGLTAPSPGRQTVRGVAVYTPVGSESEYADILPADFSLLPQRGENFGERLYFAAEDLFKCGFKTVCMIDSDSPTILAENFTKAIELLSLPGDRIVLGPCDDGGYYLIGLKRLHREVFERIDWSTERVFEQQASARAKSVLGFMNCLAALTWMIARRYIDFAMNYWAKMHALVSRLRLKNFCANLSRAMVANVFGRCKAAALLGEPELSYNSYKASLTFAWQNAH